MDVVSHLRIIMFSLAHGKEGSVQSRAPIHIPCPMRHQLYVTRVCVDPDCGLSRLGCQKCFQDAQHYSHKFQFLSNYLSALNSSDNKIRMECNKQAIKSVQGKVWNGLNQIKEEVESHFKVIESGINPTFKDILKRVDEQYSRIHSVYQKLSQLSNQHLPARLEQMLLQIHEGQKQIRNLNNRVEGMSEKMLRSFQNLNTEVGRSLGSLSHIFAIPNQMKKKECSIQPSLDLISILSQQPKHIQMLNHASSMPSLKQQSQGSNSNRSNAFNVQKYFAEIKLLPTSYIPLQSKQQLPSSQVFNWSPQLKGSNVWTEANFVARTLLLPGSCNEGVILSNQTLSKVNVFKWKIKIHKYTGWITMGICQTSDFHTRSRSKYSYLIKNLGHKFYGIGSSGYSYSSTSESKNNKKVLEEFGADGVVVEMMFDPKHSTLTFWLEKTRDKVCELEIPTDPQHEYRAFVFLYQKDSRVELVAV